MNVLNDAVNVFAFVWEMTKNKYTTVSRCKESWPQGSTSVVAVIPRKGKRFLSLVGQDWTLFVLLFMIYFWSVVCNPLLCVPFHQNNNSLYIDLCPMALFLSCHKTLGQTWMEYNDSVVSRTAVLRGSLDRPVIPASNEWIKRLLCFLIHVKRLLYDSFNILLSFFLFSVRPVSFVLELPDPLVLELCPWSYNPNPFRSSRFASSFSFFYSEYLSTHFLQGSFFVLFCILFYCLLLLSSSLPFPSRPYTPLP